MSELCNNSPGEVIFLADAHLKGQDDPNQSEFLDFLERLDPLPGSIVILGDLFEYFSGRNRAAEDAYRPVLQRLARFAPFHYMEGNHDYDLSSDILELAQLLIHPTPINTRLQRVTIRLTHGDRSNPFDLGTKLLRGCLQSGLVRWLRDSVLPHEWLFRFALAFARESRRHVWFGREHESRWARRRALRDLRNHQVEAVVFAHTHEPLLERISDCRLVANPGQAIPGGSYLKLSNRTFSLHRFPNGELLPPGATTLPDSQSS
jgi:UDP-2,3-diacylglucosamine pyrophosphatase LpxH